MTPSTPFNGCAAYPGWYAPSSDVKKILRKLDQVSRDECNKLPVKLNEFEHHYKIVTPISGVSKGDIVVYTHDGQLMIAVKKRIASNNNKRRPVQDTGYFVGIISLPTDADVEFSSAECKQGSLEICLSKVLRRPGSIDHQIIVY